MEKSSFFLSGVGKIYCVSCSKAATGLKLENTIENQNKLESKSSLN